MRNLERNTFEPLPSQQKPQLIHIEESANKILRDHKVQGVAIIPGATLLSLILSSTGQQELSLKQISFNAMIPLSDSEPAAINIVRNDDSSIAITDPDQRTTYATAIVSSSPIDREASSKPLQAAQAITVISGAEIYRRLASKGNDYGPSFRTISQMSQAEGQAEAVWQSSLPVEDSQCFITLLLDACTHTCAALAYATGTFVLESMHGVEIVDATPTTNAMIRATLLASHSLNCSAAIEILNNAGELLARIKQLNLSQIEPSSQSATSIAVAGNFTLDPLSKYSDTWNEALGLDMGIQIADYAQVFQELLTGAGVFNEQSIAHTVLLRLEDWAQEQKSTTRLPQDPSVFNGLETYQLTNGRTIAHLNDYETKYLDQEIFGDLAYRRHGIGILENEVVIDVGANIGLFSLFASQQATGVKVFAIEPSPFVLPMLRANLLAYSPSATVVAAGASSSQGQAEFTAYPKSSVFSTFSADQPADLEALTSIVRNTLIASGHEDESFVEATIAEMLEDRMQTETYKVDLVCVSDLIREHGIEKIGLLKIDAEKSEQAILAGIEDEHWPLIEQMIIEVHTQDGSDIKSVETILTRHGFEFVLDEEKLLSDSGLVTLYASRPERRQFVLAQQSTFLSDSIDLYLNAASTHAERSDRSLLTVLCPSTSNDPALIRQIEVAQEKLLEGISNQPKHELIQWNELTEQYPVAKVENRIGDRLGHIPYSDAWYAATATALLRKHHSNHRSPYKVIALDCDNTLWQGVVGELGPDNIQFEPGHLALHRFVKDRLSEGMIACLVSKNNLTDVKEVFERRPELVLKWDDFVAHQINWNAKSDNLAHVADELNLGMDSFIFLDDSGIECSEVRAAYPQILTLQVPEQSDGFAQFLAHVWAFDSSVTTDEDKQRSSRYREELDRKRFRKKASSIQEFIDGLKLTVTIADAAPDQMERISQLTNRTNQFNLTTKRRTVTEVQDLVDRSHKCWAVTVSDRFGDYGLTGVVIFATSLDRLEVDTLLLSCRVLGRGVEHQIIRQLGEEASKCHVDEIVLHYSPTGKNEPARLFLRSLVKQVSATLGESTLTLAAGDAKDTAYSPNSPETPTDGASELKEASNPSSIEISGFNSVKAEAAARYLHSVQSIVERAATKTKLARPELLTPFIAPTSDIELEIAQTWCSILGLTEVGIDDSFFELGGSSLRAVEMVVMLHDSQLIKSRLAVVDVFDAPTIRALSQVIQGSSNQHRISASKERGAARRRGLPPRRRKGRE